MTMLLAWSDIFHHVQFGLSDSGPAFCSPVFSGPAFSVNPHWSPNKDELSLSVKSVNIWRSYNQERGYLVHFLHVATTLLKGEASARANHLLACNFAKYSLI